MPTQVEDLSQSIGGSEQATIGTDRPHVMNRENGKSGQEESLRLLRDAACPAGSLQPLSAGYRKRHPPGDAW